MPTHLLGSIGEHNVVMAYLPNGEYGTNSAAAVETDLIRSFPEVCFVLIVGIAGGAPSSIHDPDSSEDVLYERGCVHSSQTERCDKTCSQQVPRRPRENDDDAFAVDCGLVASGNSLMKDAKLRDKYSAEKGVLCFEMEAAGMMNVTGCAVIRGICNYSDTHKNDHRQRFAAMIAAAYASSLRQKIQPEEVQGEKLGESWLAPPGPSVNAASARYRQHPGTGEWFIVSEQFLQWKQGERRHMWLYGMPGCGKTVLATTILDHVAALENSITISFFFDLSDRNLQTVDGMLRSLLSHLHEALSELNDPNEEFAELLNKKLSLQSLLRPSLPAWKQWRMGREHEFWSRLQSIIGGDNWIELDKKAVNTDIRAYVDFQIHNSSDSAGGMGTLQYENRFEKRLGIKREEYFAKDLGRDIQSSFGPDSTSKRAEYNSSHPIFDLGDKPLVLSEAVDIVAMRPETPKSPYDVNDRPPRPSEIVGYSPYFITLTRFDKVVEHSTQEINITAIHLSHFSIKEYLMREGGSFANSQARTSIKGCCTAYLDCLRNALTTSSDTKRPGDFPLGPYAARNWLKRLPLLGRQVYDPDGDKFQYPIRDYYGFSRILEKLIKTEPTTSRWKLFLSVRQAAGLVDDQVSLVSFICQHGLSETAVLVLLTADPSLEVGHGMLKEGRLYIATQLVFTSFFIAPQGCCTA
ncbi:uncharacterized protein PgNI_02772 [Pyricularia grisea]|uniref:Nephrocystin 3-like N-terminal domain-containing protein n=1 Tax=Pyricularia grisea TaxID=148305 RepID=A0A6P8BD29_PYRGI|nr:uncharacterized protein PgNI_02772 [Pyricularia grisea]TLD13735.1 hypothetical protein PgNI_02772 [Pyricularia grisea]